MKSFRNRNPPKDISYATDVRKSLCTLNSRNPLRDRAIDSKNLFKNLDREIGFISAMPGSYSSFDIYIDTKLNIPQPRSYNPWNTRLLFQQHEHIDMALMLRLRDYGTQSSDETNYYVDAARAVRDIRARMTTTECESHQPYVFGALLPTLDAL
jgi:hypothetical protein